MSVWTALALLTSGALASTCWCAARSIAHFADRRRTSEEPHRRRPGTRQGCWAAYAATAICVGAATGHPFAAAVLLAPALAIDHLCVRLWGKPSAEGAWTARAAHPLSDPGDEPLLQEAWCHALRLGVDPAVVDAARARCDGLLRAQQADPLELAMLDWAVFLKRRVPDLVAACGDEIGMSRDEAPHAALLGQMGEALEKIGLEAEHRRDAGRAIAHRRFEVACGHALRRVAEAQSR